MRDGGLAEADGHDEITLFHYAIDGLMLDHLTAPLDTGLAVDVAITKPSPAHLSNRALRPTRVRINTLLASNT